MKQFLPLAVPLAALVVALGSNVVMAPVAMAQVKTYYHVGAWEAFSGRDDKEGPVCGISNTIPPDNRRLSLSFDIGGTNTKFSASKPGWEIPDNTRVTVVMQIGLNTPWAAQATGHDHTIDWTLTPATMQTFDKQFRFSPSMTVAFPNGSEAPWLIVLTGSTAISDTFARCIRDLTLQVQSAQPPAAAPAAPVATQPFGASPAAPAPEQH